MRTKYICSTLTADNNYCTAFAHPLSADIAMGMNRLLCIFLVIETEMAVWFFFLHTPLTSTVGLSSPYTITNIQNKSMRADQHA